MAWGVQIKGEGEAGLPRSSPPPGEAAPGTETPSSSSTHLVLLDFLLQDLVSVRIDFHLPLLLQLAPQPGDLLLRKGHTSMGPKSEMGCVAGERP